jgi:phage-related minor tail protein
MTEIEQLLIESLKKLSAEFEAREKRLTEQLNAVVQRLDAMTQNYQLLEKQVRDLSAQLRDLAE